MKTDIYGQQIYNEVDLCGFFMQDPDRMIKDALVESKISFDSLELENVPKLKLYQDPKLTVEEFDQQKQSTWFMPEEYRQLDIAKWVLEYTWSNRPLAQPPIKTSVARYMDPPSGPLVCA